MIIVSSLHSIYFVRWAKAIISQKPIVHMHRISLKPERYAELAYLAANVGKTPKRLLEDWIQEQWAMRDEKPIVQKDDKPTCRTAQHIENIEEKTDLGRLDRAIVAQIIQAWEAGHRRKVDIARATGLKTYTVDRYVNRMKEAKVIK